MSASSAAPSKARLVAVSLAAGAAVGVACLFWARRRRRGRGPKAMSGSIAFQRACELVQGAHGRGLDNDLKLELYGWYSQAVKGDCSITQPSRLDMVGYAKWEAWQKCSGVTRKDAEAMYVAVLERAMPDWEGDLGAPAKAGGAGGGGGGALGSFGVSVSTGGIIGDPSDLDDSEIGRFCDFVKSASSAEVRARLKAVPSLAQAVDKDNMTALHWAADSGNSSVVQVLCEAKANVQARDANGDTALHLAVSCSHVDTVKTLLCHGADSGIANEDGETAAELAADDTALAALFVGG
mmetsp:Transcript_83881/g.234081  ORF Transcript_83881/g.234081 Transcript_83881/m.234081 type:complete len:295 (+) Transcript_83881:51-935(+)